MYRLLGMVAAFVFILGAFAVTQINKVANYKPATATVYEIDRNCDIVETTKSMDGHVKSSRTYNDNCKSIDAWEAAKAKHDKTISGKATIKVTYVAPQDNGSHTSELNFTSKDDEFYDLKAGDAIKVLVSNSNPDQIIKG